MDNAAGSPSANVSETRRRDRFFLAARSGDLKEVVSLAANFDINRKDLDGSSALLVAADNMQYEVAAFLAEIGADLLARNYVGRKPIHYFAKNGWLDLVERALKAGDDPLEGATAVAPWSSAVSMAISDDHPAVVRHLLRGWRRNKHERLKQLNLGLHEATSASMVETLCDLGAGVDNDVYLDKTPLMTSIVFRRDDVCQALIGRGANLEKRWNGETPLGFAAREQKTEAMVLLLNAGAQVNRCGGENESLDEIVAEKAESRAAYAAWKARQAIGRIVSQRHCVQG